MVNVSWGDGLDWTKEWTRTSFLNLDDRDRALMNDSGEILKSDCKRPTKREKGKRA